VDQELTRSGCKNLITAGVVLTGGTALIDGCQELGEQIFNLPTRIGYPRNIGGLKDVVNSPKFATAVGLLCHGAEATGKKPYVSGRGESNFFKRLFDTMREWFSDIS
jgi:cell division protein FtsA